uniref:DH domain-containing protein n=1 Tax=Steinernema glaseri TaxID=37863 RepID=A0A1I7Z301_9BILA
MQLFFAPASSNNLFVEGHFFPRARQLYDDRMNSKMMSTKKTASVPQQQANMQSASGAISADSSKVYFIIDELVETERTFGDDLQQVLEGYYYYFVENDMRYNISVCDLKSVFGGLETIQNFSRKLYEAIDRVSYSVLKTARTFLKFSIGFNDYVLYCTAYER